MQGKRAKESERETENKCQFSANSFHNDSIKQCTSDKTRQWPSFVLNWYILACIETNALNQIGKYSHAESAEYIIYLFLDFKLTANLIVASPGTYHPHFL